MQSSGEGSSSHRPPAGSANGSLDASTGRYLHHDVINSSSHLVGKRLDETPRHRYSVQSEGSPANVYHRSGHDDPSSDSRQSSSFDSTYHDEKHRNSIPSSPNWRNSTSNEKHVGLSRGGSTSAPRITHMPQRVDDLDAFRLARACGMTPDTARNNLSLAVNAGHSSGHDRAARLPPLSLPDSGYARSARSDQDEPGPDERGRSRPRPLFEHAPHDDDNSGQIDCSVPTSSTYPYLARRSSSPPRSNRGAPPFAPTLDPVKQLARINNLLSLHKQSFFGNPPDLTKPVTAESLIGVSQLMREHELDTQLETLRRELESDEELTPHEKLEGEQRSVDQRSGWRSPMDVLNMRGTDYRVFGQPLCITRMYASRASSLAGYQHDLPLVVHACVEELYRTGMTEPGLFRSPPHIARHNQLIELFDNGPFFGRSETLSKERTEDICALLRTYIDRLPRPLWHESLFDPMLKLCVSSSVFVDQPTPQNERQGEESGTGCTMPRARPTSLFVHGTPSNANVDHIHARSSSMGDITSFAICRPSSALSTVAHNEINISKERPQVSLARAFFRLLPRSHLTLLAYLCAFFSQLPLCPQNQLTIEDIARFFAIPLFLGKESGDRPISSEAQSKRKTEARMIMIWILRRWSQISEGLFDADDAGTSSSGSEDELSPNSTDDSESVRTFTSDRARHAHHDFDVGRRWESLAMAKDLSRTEDGEGILEWKDNVDHDISELRRTLLEVRARLEIGLE